MPGGTGILPCECGRAILPGPGGRVGEHRELACVCGRRCDCELGESGWSLVASLTPEKSVPVSGFSRELREEPDVERYWFLYPLKGDVALPVHVVFSPASRRAEVKAVDLKAYRFEDVDSATDARRLWISRWLGNANARRSRRPALIVPGRSGRTPPPAVPRRPSPPPAG